ncbi:MAG: DNA methylase [Candidatus Faecousia sp.]|nr:DNA methylase [Candidatus Faecousia sp.]
MEKTYVAIDLKSFYASVECVERGLDPLKTNLVVADESRTEKTICLAVSPSLKAYGIPGRARLFEVVQKVAEVNAFRRMRAPGRKLTEKSTDADLLERHRDWAVDYIVAPPQMARYVEVSSKIYELYLKYVAPEDIHVYSIDEVFIDATPYLKTYGVDGRGFAELLIRQVLAATGITATAGVGTNLYLCKVAMDIVAKHMEPDERGVRIGALNELSYRQLLWDHRPLTDFWRVGRGYSKRLEKRGLYTMGDIARCSLGGSGDFYNEELLYSIFGVNAELLIDHAWGYEPCTIANIKAYKPETNSVCSGQVLTEPYPYEKARLVAREMAEQLAMDLVDKGLVTRQLTLTIGYDIENLTRPEISDAYTGPVVTDHYGRRIPKHSHGTVNLDRPMSSSRRIMEAVMELFDRIANPMLLVRRLSISANFLEREDAALPDSEFQQLDLFMDLQAQQREDAALEREKRRQRAMLGIKRKYGKNAIFRGMDLEEGATTRARNGQIGGHKA